MAMTMKRGGLREEIIALGIPYIILRGNTEERDLSIAMEPTILNKLSREHSKNLLSQNMGVQ